MAHGKGRRKRKRKREQSRIQSHHQPKKSISEQEHRPKKSEASQKEVAIMPEVPPAKPKAKESSQGQYQKTPLWKIILEVSGVAILAIYTVGTYLQWSTMGKTLRAEQRAWINVKIPNQAPQIAVDQPIAENIQVNNIGRTPAKDVSIETLVDVIKNGESPILNGPMQHQHITTGALWPNDPREVPATMLEPDRPNKRLLKPDTFAGLMSGQYYLVIYGKVEYRDIFNVRHRTRFCTWYFYAPGNYSAEKCTASNGIDDD